MAPGSGRQQTLLIVGDVYVNRADPPTVFQHVRDRLRSADFLLGNLESPCADSGSIWHKPKGGSWKAEPRQLDAVIDARFSALSATNNHIMDYGHDALLETLTHLDRAGIGHAGAGPTLAEARRPAIIDRDGTRIAMLAHTCVFTPGWEATAERPGLSVLRAHTAFEPHPRLYETPGKPPTVRSWMAKDDKAQLALDIAAARAEADLVICSFHWGVSEGYEALTEYQVELGHDAIESGADLVFGHHPHLIQGIEVFQGRPIFYSLGNFSFARQNPAAGHEYENIMARCTIRDGRIVSVGYLPVLTDRNLDPRVLPASESADIAALVARRSKRFGTRFAAEGDAIRVVMD